jgi:hypothetical protein
MNIAHMFQLNKLISSGTKFNLTWFILVRHTSNSIKDY